MFSSCTHQADRDFQQELARAVARVDFPPLSDVVCVRDRSDIESVSMVLRMPHSCASGGCLILHTHFAVHLARERHAVVRCLPHRIFPIAACGYARLVLRANMLYVCGECACGGDDRRGGQWTMYLHDVSII